MDSNAKPKIILYSVREYDAVRFERFTNQFNMKFLEHRLDERTAVFAYGCDAVVACPMDIITAPVIDELVECGVKLLAMRSAGYNNVDIAHARGRLSVVRVPDYSPNSVAEFAAALMFTLIRGTHKAYNRTRSHDFSINNLAGFELHGKTCGIVGEGRIGSCAVNISKGIGMKVLVNTPHPRGTPGVEYCSLDELFERSDVIQLHCPLTEANRHMINDASIARMKQGALLINTARGGLVDSEALIRGLVSRRIRGAALDVYENEGGTFTVDYTNDILEDRVLQILLGFPNVIITSHQAYFTEESLENICITTMENIREFLETGECKNLIETHAV